MLAYAVGFEAGVRTGWSAPGHHKGGWHLTGTLGTIAAGVAGGKLIGLDAPAPDLCDGDRRHPGRRHAAEPRHLCKSFHAGKAAANGVLAALLAERGFDSTQEIIEGRKGFSRIYSDVAAPEQLTAGLDQGWLIETNGHKPYACGVVLHPLIDAVIALRDRDRIDPGHGERDQPPGAPVRALHHRRGRSRDRPAIEVQHRRIPPPWRWSTALPASRNIPTPGRGIRWWRRCAER